jgi:hypothetical protein
MVCCVTVPLCWFAFLATNSLGRLPVRAGELTRYGRETAAFDKADGIILSHEVLWEVPKAKTCHPDLAIAQSLFFFVDSKSVGQ